MPYCVAAPGTELPHFMARWLVFLYECEMHQTLLAGGVARPCKACSGESKISVCMMRGTLCHRHVFAHGTFLFEKVGGRA